MASPKVLLRKRRVPTVPPNSEPSDSLMTLNAPPPFGRPLVQMADMESDVKKAAEQPRSTMPRAPRIPACPVIQGRRM